MVTVQGAFLDHVGPSNALLQLPEHMQSNPLLCGRSVTCYKPESRDTALWETEELDVWRLLRWKFYYSLRVDLLAGAQL